MDPYFDPSNFALVLILVLSSFQSWIAASEVIFVWWRRPRFSAGCRRTCSVRKPPFISHQTDLILLGFFSRFNNRESDYKRYTMDGLGWTLGGDENLPQSCPHNEPSERRMQNLITPLPEEKRSVMFYKPNWKSFFPGTNFCFLHRTKGNFLKTRTTLHCLFNLLVACSPSI